MKLTVPFCITSASCCRSRSVISSFPLTAISIRAVHLCMNTTTYAILLDLLKCISLVRSVKPATCRTDLTHTVTQSTHIAHLIDSSPSLQQKLSHWLVLIPTHSREKRLILQSKCHAVCFIIILNQVTYKHI